jgi:hypothetical protein
LEYDPTTKTTRVLLDGLVYANGVTLSKEEDCIKINKGEKSRKKEKKKRSGKKNMKKRRGKKDEKKRKGIGKRELPASLYFTIPLS